MAGKKTSSGGGKGTPARKVVDVNPRPDKRWEAKTEGTSRAAKVTETKAEAIEAAKQIAKNAPLGQVRIKGEDGKIQTEHTYGKDPYPPKG